MHFLKLLFIFSSVIALTTTLHASSREGTDRHEGGACGFSREDIVLLEETKKLLKIVRDNTEMAEILKNTKSLNLDEQQTFDDPHARDINKHLVLLRYILQNNEADLTKHIKNGDEFVKGLVSQMERLDLALQNHIKCETEKGLDVDKKTNE